MKLVVSLEGAVLIARSTRDVGSIFALKQEWPSMAVPPPSMAAIRAKIDPTSLMELRGCEPNFTLAGGVDD